MLQEGICNMAENNRGPGLTAAHGEWAGWSVSHGDPFNDHVGPFHYRKDGDGTLVCAMEVEAKHLNGGGGLHGGALATFADFCLFAFAGLTGNAAAVTVSLHCDYVGGAGLGDRIECRGHVTRETGSMIFLGGTITHGSAPVMAFSGILKKLRSRP